MILIDSSVWIAFFNGSGGNAVSALETLIDDEEEVYLSEYILTEVLQGFRKTENTKRPADACSDFRSPGLEIRTPILKRPKSIGSAGEQGITIRKTADCLIARTAMENDLYLLHQDSDFDRIASVCPLKIYAKGI